MSRAFLFVCLFGFVCWQSTHWPVAIDVVLVCPPSPQTTGLCVETSGASATFQEQFNAAFGTTEAHSLSLGWPIDHHNQSLLVTFRLQRITLTTMPHTPWLPGQLPSFPNINDTTAPTEHTYQVLLLPVVSDVSSVPASPSKWFVDSVRTLHTVVSADATWRSLLPEMALTLRTTVLTASLSDVSSRSSQLDLRSHYLLSASLVLAASADVAARHQSPDPSPAASLRPVVGAFETTLSQRVLEPWTSAWSDVFHFSVDTQVLYDAPLRVTVTRSAKAGTSYFMSGAALSGTVFDTHCNMSRMMLACVCQLAVSPPSISFLKILGCVRGNIAQMWLESYRGCVYRTHPDTLASLPSS